MNDSKVFQTNSSACDSSMYSLSWTIILTLLSVSTSLITIIGNILVISAFSLERKIRVVGNYFIVSLAVTDLLIGLFSMNLYTAYLLLGCWPLGSLLCDLWLSLDYTACLTSQFTVLSITVDRYCSVKIPNLYRSWRSQTKILIIIAAAWLIPSFVFFTTILGWPIIAKRERKVSECYAEFTLKPVFNTLFTVAYFWIPFLIMLFLYYGIYKVACNLQRKSDERHKKMTTLMEMAGQTMSRIGVGVGWNKKDIDDEFIMMEDNLCSGDFDKSDRFIKKSNNRTPYYSKDLSKAVTSEEISKSSPGIATPSPIKSNQLNFTDDEDNVEKDCQRLYADDTVAETSSQNTDCKTPENKTHRNQLSITYVTNTTTRVVNQGVAATISSSLIGVLKRPYYNKMIKQSKRIKNMSRSENRARKAFRTISLILGAFLACWTPYHVLVMIKAFCDDVSNGSSCINEYLYSVSYWLCYMNSPINPFCYALANIQFKKTFIRILKGDVHHC